MSAVQRQLWSVTDSTVLSIWKARVGEGISGR